MYEQVYVGERLAEQKFGFNRKTECLTVSVYLKANRWLIVKRSILPERNVKCAIYEFLAQSVKKPMTFNFISIFIMGEINQIEFL